MAADALDEEVAKPSSRREPTAFKLLVADVQELPPLRSFLLFLGASSLDVLAEAL